MAILAISENQGVKSLIFDKDNLLHLCGPKFQNKVSKKQIVLSSDFSVSIIKSNTKNALF